MRISKPVEIAASPGDFAWVRGNRPLVLVSGYVGIVIRTSTDGLAVDKFVLSTDPKFDPKKSDAMTPAPEPVSDLAAVETTPQSVKIAWKPSPSLNVARYDVHVGGTDDPASLGNATIIGSTTGTTFRDWGLRPGTAYTYHVVAVDSRGSRSTSPGVTVNTKPQPVQTLTAAGRTAGQKVTFTADVKTGAPFMLWVKYRPAYVGSRQLRVGVEIDGKAVGTWQLRAPYRPMSGTLVGKTAGEPRVFVDKVLADGKDVFDLTPGGHTVTFTLEAKLFENKADPKPFTDFHDMQELTLSNDHGFRPPGWDPRADFRKAPRRY